MPSAMLVLPILKGVGGREKIKPKGPGERAPIARPRREKKERREEEKFCCKFVHVRLPYPTHWVTDRNAEVTDVETPISPPSLFEKVFLSFLDW